MTQFDQTTEKKGVAFFGNAAVLREEWQAGRNSTKASMEILARFVENYEGTIAGDKVIAQVKANGDWPLEEK